MTYQLTTSQKRWATLGIGTSAFMIAMEFYIVGVIIPILIQHFNTKFATAQWIILIYTLVLTVLVLGVARLGDIYDKKLLFLGGLVLFTISSLLCGLAPNIAFLIVFRGLQGLGAVFVWALRNAIITEIFPEEERGRVLGWVTGCASLGLASGSRTRWDFDWFWWLAFSFLGESANWYSCQRNCCQISPILCW